MLILSKQSSSIVRYEADVSDRGDILLASIVLFYYYHFSCPGRVVSKVCLCVCQGVLTIIFERSDFLHP